MTKDEMKKGFAVGRVLMQEEWSTPEEIQAVNELITEGLARPIFNWTYLDNFQCEVRKIEGVRQ